MLSGAARRAFLGEIRSNQIDEHLTGPAPNLFRPSKAESGLWSLHGRLKPKRPIDNARNLQLDRPVRHKGETDPRGYEADHGLLFRRFQNDLRFFAGSMKGPHDGLVTMRPHLPGWNDQGDWREVVDVNPILRCERVI